MDQSRQHDLDLQHPCPEKLFQTKSEKDLPDMRSDGVESIYWAGTELLGWYRVGSNGHLQLPWGHLRH